jgi:hypothetical protein
MEANTISAVNQYLFGVFRSKGGDFLATAAYVRFLEEKSGVLALCQSPTNDFPLID